MKGKQGRIPPAYDVDQAKTSVVHAALMVACQEQHRA